MGQLDDDEMDMLGTEDLEENKKMTTDNDELLNLIEALDQLEYHNVPLKIEHAQTIRDLLKRVDDCKDDEKEIRDELEMHKDTIRELRDNLEKIRDLVSDL